MSLKSDIDETIELWKGATLPTKALIVLSLLLATSSITSIADVVFGWKGFILQGVEFYQNTVRKPIAWLFSWAKIPEEVVDGAIALTIGLGAFFRSNKGDIPIHGFWRFTLRVLVFGIIGGLVGFLIAILLPEYRSFLFVCCSIVLLGFFYDLSKREKISYFTYIGCIFLTILILAAINLGLTMPPPSP